MRSKETGAFVSESRFSGLYCRERAAHFAESTLSRDASTKTSKAADHVHRPGVNSMNGMVDIRKR